VIINIGEYGNTTAATIPLATRDALESGKLKKGDTVLFAAVGAGYTGRDEPLALVLSEAWLSRQPRVPSIPSQHPLDVLLRFAIRRYRPVTIHGPGPALYAASANEPDRQRSCTGEAILSSTWLRRERFSRHRGDSPEVARGARHQLHQPDSSLR
jgi:hypothetical protein